MSAPLVSVIIPSYNYGNFLREAIQSVLDQTFQDFEIIVVDGQSTDNTPNVVQEFSGKIRFICQENKGHIIARNTGIAAASGEYIAFLDADDLWLPAKLERQVPLLQNRAEVGLVYGTIYQFENKSGAIVGEYPLAGCRRGRVLAELYLNNFVPAPTPLIRKSVLDEVGNFDERIRYGSEDWDLWLRIAAKYEFDFVPEPLAKYRYHGSHRSKLGYLNREAQTLETIERAALTYPDELGPLRARKVSSFKEAMGLYLIRQGDKREGLRRLQQAIRTTPSRLPLYLLWLASALGPRLSPERSREATINYFFGKHSLFNHNYRQARKEFLRAIWLDPISHRKAYAGLLLSFLGTNRVDKARAKVRADRYLTTTRPDPDGVFDQW